MSDHKDKLVKLLLLAESNMKAVPETFSRNEALVCVGRALAMVEKIRFKPAQASPPPPPQASQPPPRQERARRYEPPPPPDDVDGTFSPNFDPYHYGWSLSSNGNPTAFIHEMVTTVFRSKQGAVGFVFVVDGSFSQEVYARRSDAMRAAEKFAEAVQKKRSERARVDEEFRRQQGNLGDPEVLDL